MTYNTFGHLFRVTTFGESHGVAIGCVIDGCPPRIPLEAKEIQMIVQQFPMPKPSDDLVEALANQIVKQNTWPEEWFTPDSSV